MRTKIMVIGMMVMLTALFAVGSVTAGQTAAPCGSQAMQCDLKDGTINCSWYEGARSAHTYRGRAGQLEYVPAWPGELKEHRCTLSEKPNV